MGRSTEMVEYSILIGAKVELLRSIGFSNIKYIIAWTEWRSGFEVGTFGYDPNQHDPNHL